MTPDERLKVAIGDLFLRAVFAEARAEQLAEQAEELTARLAANEPPKGPDEDDGA